MNETRTMLQDRGEEYVTNWPRALARKIGCSPEYIADAMEREGVQAPARLDIYHPERYVPLVGALTPDRARNVACHLREIAAEVAEQTRNSCWDCGRPLVQGHCDCGAV